MESTLRHQVALMVAGGAAAVAVVVLAPVLLPWTLLARRPGKGNAGAMLLGSVGLLAWMFVLDATGCATPWIVVVPTAIAGVLAAVWPQRRSPERRA